MGEQEPLRAVAEEGVGGFGGDEVDYFAGGGDAAGYCCDGGLVGGRGWLVAEAGEVDEDADAVELDGEG